MNTENLFEMATREKLRFQYKGLLTVEDLWDLDVHALDTVFKGLNAKAKASEEESLLQTKSKTDSQVAAQIEIVKHIVSVKLKEAEARKAAKENREKRQRIMEIMADKQDAELKEMSVADLQKMLESME